MEALIPPVTIEMVRRVFDYDPVDGSLIWRVKPTKNVCVGDIAGTIERRGYVKIRLAKTNQLAHRLVWAYVYGEWPYPCIDHKDGNRSNNRIANLRLAQFAENSWNRTRSGPRNTTGTVGVRFIPEINKYHAYITVKGVRHGLGYTTSLEEAISKRREAEHRLCGDFAPAACGQ